jgi:hypothetical protein
VSLCRGQAEIIIIIIICVFYFEEMKIVLYKGKRQIKVRVSADRVITDRVITDRVITNRVITDRVIIHVYTDRVIMGYLLKRLFEISHTNGMNEWLRRLVKRDGSMNLPVDDGGGSI